MKLIFLLFFEITLNITLVLAKENDSINMNNHVEICDRKRLGFSEKVKSVTVTSKDNPEDITQEYVFNENGNLISEYSDTHEFKSSISEFYFYSNSILTEKLESGVNNRYFVYKYNNKKQLKTVTIYDTKFYLYVDENGKIFTCYGNSPITKSDLTLEKNITSILSYAYDSRGNVSKVGIKNISYSSRYPNQTSMSTEYVIYYNYNVYGNLIEEIEKPRTFYKRYAKIVTSNHYDALKRLDSSKMEIYRFWFLKPEVTNYYYFYDNKSQLIKKYETDELESDNEKQEMSFTEYKYSADGKVTQEFKYMIEESSEESRFGDEMFAGKYLLIGRFSTMQQTEYNEFGDVLKVKYYSLYYTNQDKPTPKSIKDFDTSYFITKEPYLWSSYSYKYY